MRLFEGTPFDRPPRCSQCGELEQGCVCPPGSPARLLREQPAVRVKIEKRKKGKIVTVVRGLTAGEADLLELLRQLKTTCGAGGTLRDGELEVQGEHQERIRGALTSIGYRIAKG